MMNATQRVNKLAGSLTAAGVQVGDYVPVLFEKLKWHIVSIFAVSFLRFCLSLSSALA